MNLITSTFPTLDSKSVQLAQLIEELMHSWLNEGFLFSVQVLEYVRIHQIDGD